MLSSAWIMTTFSSVSSVVQIVYGVPGTLVNSCVVLFLISFILFNFLTVASLEKFGISITVSYIIILQFKVAAAASIIGAALRWIMLRESDHFYLLLIGQAISAISNPFLNNGASKLATSWFGEKERALATSIGSLSTPLGCIFGLAVGPFFILDSDKSDIAEGKRHVIKYMEIMTGVTLCLNLPLIIFL
jgi:MFS transporter, FLVCR family, feline leukemia virus subgroup C receptor-related protein